MPAVTPHWRDVRKVATNVGQTLQTALRCIEQANPHIVRLMVEILDPRAGESIYDPACGTGGMLLEAIHHVQETRRDVRTLWGRLYGQEKNLTTSAIARMNLFLHGAADFQIIRDDTLRSPAYFLLIRFSN